MLKMEIEFPIAITVDSKEAPFGIDETLFKRRLIASLFTDIDKGTSPINRIVEYAGYPFHGLLFEFHADLNQESGCIKTENSEIHPTFFFQAEKRLFLFFEKTMHLSDIDETDILDLAEHPDFVRMTYFGLDCQFPLLKQET